MKMGLGSVTTPQISDIIIYMEREVAREKGGTMIRTIGGLFG